MTMLCRSLVSWWNQWRPCRKPVLPAVWHDGGLLPGLPGGCQAVQVSAQGTAGGGQLSESCCRWATLWLWASECSQFRHWLLSSWKILTVWSLWWLGDSCTQFKDSCVVFFWLFFMLSFLFRCEWQYVLQVLLLPIRSTSGCLHRYMCAATVQLTAHSGTTTSTVSSVYIDKDGACYRSFDPAGSKWMVSCACQDVQTNPYQS